MKYFIKESKLDEVKPLEELEKNRQEEAMKKMEENKDLNDKIQMPPQMVSQMSIEENSFDVDDYNDGIKKGAKFLLDAHLNLEKAFVELKKVLVDIDNQELIDGNLRKIIFKLMKISSIIKKTSDKLMGIKK